MFEVEEAQHTKLRGCVLRPVRFSVEDGDHVHVMDHDFHGKQYNNEANGVHGSAFSGDAMRAVPLLRDPIVERHDRTSEVQWRVHCIGKVVAKGEVLWLSRNSDTIALGEVRGIELLLLDVISMISKNGKVWYTSRGLPARE